jgi:hypothetical protein
MDPTPDGTLSGAAPGDRLGLSVAAAGDVNADGFGDLVAGAPGADVGGTDSGAAYLFFGGTGTSFDPTPDATLSGDAPGDAAGQRVAGAGDVNGDGFADLVVGAPQNDAIFSNAGAAYVYLGGSGGFSTAADTVLSGEAGSDNFGDLVASAGDLNGDGWSDLVVIASHNATGGMNAGKVYVYFGSIGTSVDATADATFLGTTSARFEYGAGSAGDVNDDGFSDLLLASAYDDTNGVDSGRAWLYLGGPGTTLDSTADTMIDGATGGTGLGYEVAGVGDVNSDGYADVSIAALLSDAGGPDSGASYVYFGGPLGLDATPDGALLGSASDWLGRSVAAAGDVNGDGFGDLIVGLDQTQVGGSGSANIYLGGTGATFDPAPDTTLTGTMPLQRFGFSVACYLQPLAPRGAGLHPRG